MFRHYENFSDQGAPQVLIPNGVVERYGQPAVNSDNLGQLFEEDLGLPAEDVTLKFYSGHQIGDSILFLESWPYGRILPLTNTIQVAAYDGSFETPMKKVITLGHLMADRQTQNPLRRYLSNEVTLASGAAFGAGIVENLAYPSMLGFLGLVEASVMKSANMNVHNTSNRHWDEINNLRSRHDSDITFPKQKFYYRDREARDYSRRQPHPHPRERSHLRRIK